MRMWAGTAVVIKNDVEVPELHYYGDDSTVSLFTYANSASLRSDEGMKAFLEGVGSVSESYTDAIDIVHEYEGVIYGKSSDDNNLAFYAGIGILVVVIIILCVLLYKKER